MATLGHWNMDTERWSPVWGWDHPRPTRPVAPLAQYLSVLAALYLLAGIVVGLAGLIAGMDASGLAPFLLAGSVLIGFLAPWWGGRYERAEAQRRGDVAALSTEAEVDGWQETLRVNIPLFPASLAFVAVLLLLNEIDGPIGVIGLAAGMLAAAPIQRSRDRRRGWRLHVENRLRFGRGPKPYFYVGP